MFPPPVALADVMVPAAFLVVAILAILAQTIALLWALFDRGLRYEIDRPDLSQIDERQFLHTLELVTGGRLSRDTRLDVLTNGEQYYPAELEAIAEAHVAVHLEAYMFERGQVAGQFVGTLAERARAGVEVRLVLDAVGSSGCSLSYFKPITDAGGKVAFYHPLRFATLPRFNNRTHRELLILDGRAAFVGGPGISDHWLVSTPKHKRWRDTVVRVEGSAVNELQATFAENWLEGCGELLVGDRHFPVCEHQASGSLALVVSSTPSAGASTRARVLFQMLLAAASRSIHITTPYFLPDRSLSAELRKAVARGVTVQVLVPGKHNDLQLVRSSSRLAYGRLLQYGIRIFEYQPTMMHAKVLLVDGVWGVVGSTNFDNRSFGLNDEANVAVCDRAFAARLEEDFVRDLTEAREISYAEWKQRGVFERVPELVGWVLERQQ